MDRVTRHHVGQLLLNRWMITALCQHSGEVRASEREREGGRERERERERVREREREKEGERERVNVDISKL